MITTDFKWTITITEQVPLSAVNSCRRSMCSEITIWFTRKPSFAWNCIMIKAAVSERGDPQQELRGRNDGR